MSPKWRAAQKFEDWERKGVRVRVELGLRESDSGTVTYITLKNRLRTPYMSESYMSAHTPNIPAKEPNTSAK